MEDANNIENVAEESKAAVANKSDNQINCNPNDTKSQDQI